jgi:hypothetical protein
MYSSPGRYILLKKFTNSIYSIFEFSTREKRFCQCSSNFTNGYNKIPLEIAFESLKNHHYIEGVKTSCGKARKKTLAWHNAVQQVVKNIHYFHSAFISFFPLPASAPPHGPSRGLPGRLACLCCSGLLSLCEIGLHGRF